MISLIYKIMGDVNPFKQAVTKEAPAAAAKGGSEAGKFFGAQFKGAILKYIGAGAILATITKLAADAAQIVKDATQADLGVEAFQEMRKAAELTGLSIDELKKKAIEAPKEFAALMKSIRETGGILKKEDVENFAKLDEIMSRVKSKAASFLVSIWRALEFLNFGRNMGPTGTKEMDRVSRELRGLPPDEGGESARTPAQKFKDALKAREEGRKNLASDLGNAASLITMGLGVSQETARKAGLVPKSKEGAKTIDDLIKAIEEQTALIDRKV
jgi:hypothetical protein